MSKNVLVTGASGFIGQKLVETLSMKGFRVKACIRNPGKLEIFNELDGVEAIQLDILDKKSLLRAMSDVHYVYHLAAFVDARAERNKLVKANVEGTKNVWESAADSGVEKALYCSTTAVYGLLSKGHQPISENVIPRAIEPYGRSKLLGENEALGISVKASIPTVIIRPVAVFGPGQNTRFGKKLQRAAISRLLLAAGFEKRAFNFVHVEDVVDACIHLMGVPHSSGEIYNIAAEVPILYEEAFNVYRNVLRKSSNPLYWQKFLADISALIHRHSSIAGILSKVGSKQLVFRIWQPGFDMTYSSEKLIRTGFRYKWSDFEEVLSSCMHEK